MSTSSSSTKLSEQEIVNKFNSYKSELQAIATKISELEAEVDEHKLVIDTITPLNQDRKCYRMVGGVLVEKTVEEILPNLKTNFDGIQNMINQLLKSYQTKEEEFKKFQATYKIKITKSGE